MRRRTVVWIGVVAFIAACLVAAGGYLLTRVPAVEALLPPGSSPVHVRLTVPVAPAGWPLNAFIPVQAEAYGGGAIAALELYINGQLYQQVQPPAGSTSPEFAAGWTWQPGSEGAFILTARATSADGGSGISAPIRLEVTGAARPFSLYPAKSGETLQTIAESNRVTLEELMQANPTVADPAQALPDDTLIHLPGPLGKLAVPPIAAFPGGLAEIQPRVDLNLPTLPEAEETATPAGPPEADSPQFHLPSMQDLKFWIDVTLPGQPAAPPIEPVLQASFKQCNVTLQLANAAQFDDAQTPTGGKNESGFFVYRSQDGGSFERVATLPAITAWSSWDYRTGYTLPDQHGLVSYTLAAFNPAGETVSAPVALPLDQANCLKPAGQTGEESQIELEDGALVLPAAMDMAYMYLSINDGGPERVPEGDRMFLPNSGVKLDLNDYFNTRLATFTTADFEVAMQVWGWSGSQLVLVGDYQTTIHRSVLLVCSQEGEGRCSGNGDGQWLTEINLSGQKPIQDQIYEFKWIGSQISKVKDVCYQFAAGPFPNDDFWTMDQPITSGCMEYISGNEGTFTMPMGSLLYPTEPPEYTGWGAGSQLFDYHSTWFQESYPVGTPFSLYARALPRLQMSGFTQFSNPVILHNNTAPAPSGLPPLASPYPSLYEVEILRDTYIPPTFETEENWGCVVVEEDPGNPSNVGKTLCPPEMTAKDDCAGESEALCLLKGMGDAIVSLADQFVYSIQMIKQEMTEAISYAIPYCHDYGPCYQAIDLVVEQIVYYGIGYPPGADSTEDLAAGWMGGYMLSTAGEFTQSIGYGEEDLKKLCGDDCQKDIGMQVIQNIRRKKSMESQNACINAYQAYFHDREAMCLDPSVIVHPAEGSGDYPAGITIKITRKANPPGQPQPAQASEHNQVRVKVTAQNDATAYGAGYTTELYFPVTIPVELKDPGETIVFNTRLIPCTSFGSTTCGAQPNWDGTEIFYYNGMTTIEASELCYSPNSSQEWVPCAEGGYDRWQFENPKQDPPVQP